VPSGERSVEALAPPRSLALSLPQLWIVAAIVLPVVALHGALGTIDIAYHLRAGDLMLRSGSIIRLDTFTFTVAGQPWLDQQWGAQVLLDLVYRATGWLGLAALEAALTAFVFGFVYLAGRAAGGSVRRSAWLTIAAAAVALTGMTLRPQLMGAALFAVSLWAVAGRRSHPGRLWMVPALVAVWANVHGSFLLGPLLLGLAWTEDVLDRDPGARRTMAVGVAGVAAATLNPFGLRVWSYAVDISTSSVISRLITEWQPPSIRRIDDALFFCSLAGVGLILARRRGKVAWGPLLHLGVFLGMALLATRNVLWWSLAAAPALCRILAEEPSRRRREMEPSLLNTSIAACLVLLALLFVSLSAESEGLRTPGQRVADAPVALTSELQQVLRPGERVFNAQRWGSWFELALPDHPVFVDSRIELFPTGVWNDYLNVSVAREGWQEILSRWNVRVLALHPVQQEDLIPAVARDPHWRRVYRDDDGSIFVRVGSG
jgi:hypothetical protein